MKANSKAAKFISKLMTFVMAAALAMTSATFPVKAENEDYTADSNRYRNVMYYGDWSVWGGQNNFYPKGIPADQLTHLNFAFLNFDAGGNLAFTDRDAAVGNPVGIPGAQWGGLNAGVLSGFQDLRAQNPNLRIGVSVGGWSLSNDFAPMAANPTARANFISNVCKFIKYTNMDFVDLDWEYPGAYRLPDKVDNKNDEGTLLSTPQDKDNFITLLSELRVALDRQAAELDRVYELTVALPATAAQLDLGVDVARLFEIVDFANIMTYDLSGAWNQQAGHHSALYTNPYDPYKSSGLSIDDAVDYLLSKGAVADKIVIGAAFYTRGWEKVTNDGGVPGLPGLFGTAAYVNKDADQTPSYGAAAQAPLTVGDGGRRTGIWSYGYLDSLKAKYPGLAEYWDDVAKAPYLYNVNTGAFFTFDNPRSLGEKAEYVKQNGLGGIISWQQANDKDTGSGKRDELTKAIKTGLFGAATPLPQYKIGDAPIDMSVTGITTYSDFSGEGYEFTIRNNAIGNESGDVLARVEAMAETVKLPKLYIKSASGATFSTGGYGSGSVSNQNGYAVVNLHEVYTNQNITPGTSVTFKLKVSGAADVKDIAAIEISQRISTSGPEISRQAIYGDSDVNHAPVISGVSDKSVQLGAGFNPLAGVTAYDQEDGAISNVTVSGSVNTNAAGNYTLTYTVRDSGGLTATKTCVITVVAPVNAAPVLNGVGNKTIELGDSFDALAGVTAYDAEDGAITNITVTGTVDTNVAGSYTLNYSVSDSAGKTTAKSCVVTVRAPYVNTPPVISGVADRSIALNSAFDALAGVSAGDAEDGAINGITVTGTVNTAVAGDYPLTYSVVDSNGLSASASCVITVLNSAGDDDEDDGDDGDDDGDGYETYDPGKIYLAGDVVSYNGEVYRCKWWIKGNGTPDMNSAWEKISNNSGSEIAEYSPAKEYTGGSQVTYNGLVYEAKWWTKGDTPGVSDVWKLVP